MDMITRQGKRDARHRWRSPRLMMVAAVVGLVALAAACGSSGNSSSSSSTSSPAAGKSASAATIAAGLRTKQVGGTTVLTNSKGFTLYTFAPDTPTKSACNGACAATWPPQKASGTVKSPYTKITRSDGSSQLAFHGHPLYTYTGDSAPGQANGNGLNTFGGLWHEAPASGGTAPAGTSSPGGGGY
jgi:predicted lipoprotein with Yx(FWY)xxD motif